MKEEELNFYLKHIKEVDSLSPKELRWLNSMVVNRMNALDRIKDLEAVSAFKRGDKVVWIHEGISYDGWVTKTNQVTVSVTELKEPYRKWKLTPEYLQKI